MVLERSDIDLSRTVSAVRESSGHTCDNPRVCKVLVPLRKVIAENLVAFAIRMSAHVAPTRENMLEQGVAYGRERPRAPICESIGLPAFPHTPHNAQIFWRGLVPYSKLKG